MPARIGIAPKVEKQGLDILVGNMGISSVLSGGRCALVLGIASLSVYAAIQSYSMSAAMRSHMPDPYGVAVDLQRFALVPSRIPGATEPIQYLSDLPDQALPFLTAQYALAPHLLIRDGQSSARWAVGNFSQSADVNGIAKRAGFRVVEDLGAGVFVLRSVPMILALFACLPAAVLGWALVRLLLPIRAGERAWERWVFEASLGWAVGVGLSSCVFFVLTWMGVAIRPAILTLESVIAGGLIAMLALRKKAPLTPAPRPPMFRLGWILQLAAGICLLIFLLNFSEATAALPDGEWDAFSIWNVRAKFLAGPGTWWNAISPQWAAGLSGASHPGYPLLLSGFIARTWTVLGDTTPEVGGAVSLAFVMAVCGVLFGSLCRVRSSTTGALAVVVLLATFWGLQAAWQCADIPLGLYFVASLAVAACAAESAWPRKALVWRVCAADLRRGRKTRGSYSFCC
ncbi:MAG TPA: hypothetical protein VFE22_02895 [Edaphobacter sp.]|nr:hypothetical protein [Edaphobacter sp.]